MITREEAEKIVRKIISNHLGEKLPPNLFNDSVDEFMKEVNKSNEEAKGLWGNSDASASIVRQQEIKE